MRSISKLLLVCFLWLPLLAQEDPTQELQKALQGFMLFLQESQKSLKELSQSDQKPIPEEKNGFELYYKKVFNAAKVQERNDLLIKTQIGYKFLREKEIPSSHILILVQNGNVELYGKVHSPKTAQKCIDTALKVRGVKSVTSYLIIKEVAKIFL